MYYYKANKQKRRNIYSTTNYFELHFDYVMDVMDEWLAFLIRISIVLDSNLGQETGYHLGGLS
jgi:hypothetical protein